MSRRPRQVRAALAQSAEHLTRNEVVRGSIPRGGSIRNFPDWGTRNRGAWRRLGFLDLAGQHQSGNFAEASKVSVDHVSVEVGGHHGGGVSENATMLSAA